MASSFASAAHHPQWAHTALREVARILRPSARFVFTSWDFTFSSPEEPQLTDHRPLVREAGFVVEAYEVDPMFEVHFRALLERCEEQRTALMGELVRRPSSGCWHITTGDLRSFLAGSESMWSHGSVKTDVLA